jgi:oligopeptide/dipeptide ABC transporter ATP-binding protein
MYAGELVEQGPTSEVLRSPAHPYTRGLIDSLPETSPEERLRPIPGSPPEPGDLPAGCAFAPRCSFATDECRQGPIALGPVATGHLVRCLHADRVLARHGRLDAAAEAELVVADVPVG